MISRDGSSRPKPIDPYGYHLVGCKCKIGANAIRLHDEVVAMVAKLFRALRLDAIFEPTRLFNNPNEDASSQRPDIFIRNPRGLGRQVIIDVAVTGVNGLNMATSLSRIDFNLFRLSFLIQGKFTTLSKISFGSRFVIRLLPLRAMQSHLTLALL